MSSESAKHSSESAKMSCFQFPISLRSDKQFSDVEEIKRFLSREAEQRKMPHCLYLYGSSYIPSKDNWKWGSLRCRVKECPASINFIKKGGMLSTTKITSAHDHRSKEKPRKQKYPVEL